MRYFLENFKETHNRDWLFGHFPAYEYYPSTGTHVGTDFKVVIGSSIIAPIDGKMFKTEYNQYKGNVGIYIFKHETIEWGLELCHLRELPNKGKYKEGEIIAYSGNTGGTTTGAHLHAVLHRDAMVSKHYQQLKLGKRDAFLQLEKDGAIVDCFTWFSNNIEEVKEKPKEIKDNKIETKMPPLYKNPIKKARVTKPPTALDRFLKFLSSIFTGR